MSKTITSIYTDSRDVKPYTFAARSDEQARTFRFKTQMEAEAAHGALVEIAGYRPEAIDDGGHRATKISQLSRYARQIAERPLTPGAALANYLRLREELLDDS